MRRQNNLSGSLSILALCVLFLTGEVLCLLRVLDSDFKPSYKREIIYGVSLVTGLGGFVGWFDIPDEVEDANRR